MANQVDTEHFLSKIYKRLLNNYCVKYESKDYTISIYYNILANLIWKVLYALKMHFG